MNKKLEYQAQHQSCQNLISSFLVGALLKSEGINLVRETPPQYHTKIQSLLVEGSRNEVGLTDECAYTHTTIPTSMQECMRTNYIHEHTYKHTNRHSCKDTNGLTAISSCQFTNEHLECIQHKYVPTYIIASIHKYVHTVQTRTYI